MAVTFKLTGDRRLDRLFASLPKRVQGKVLRPALRAAAKTVNEAAKANAPVDTGKLRKSLKVRAGKRTRRGVVRVVVQTGQDDNLFTGETFYGAFQEFGWKTGKRRGTGKRRQITGKHYIKRAYDSKGEQAKQQALDMIRVGIEREARSGGG